MQEKTILDLYKRLNTLTYATFTQYNSLITGANPFDSYDDIDYYLSHSSRKFLSQFVYNIMDVYQIEDLDHLTNTELNLIFTTIGSKYANKWNRLYQALVATTYEPDENYNMVEEMMVQSYGTETTTQILNQIVKNKIDQTETSHIDETEAEELNQIVKNKFNQTETSHIDQKTTDKKDETKTINNTTYGFNSATAVDTGGGTENIATGTDGNTSETKTGNSGNRTILSTTGDGNTVETQTVGDGNQMHRTTGSDGNRVTLKTNGNNGNTVETLTQGDGNVTTTTKEVTPYKLTRHGNIGVTTNQQMIMQEIELRQNLFKEIVYRDVDSMLTSSIYFH